MSPNHRSPSLRRSPCQVAVAALVALALTGCSFSWSSDGGLTTGPDSRQDSDSAPPPALSRATEELWDLFEGAGVPRGTEHCSPTPASRMLGPSGPWRCFLSASDGVDAAGFRRLVDLARSRGLEVEPATAGSVDPYTRSGTATVSGHRFTVALVYSEPATATSGAVPSLTGWLSLDG